METCKHGWTVPDEPCPECGGMAEREYLVEGVWGHRITYRVRARSRYEAIRMAEDVYRQGGDFERTKEADHIWYDATPN